MIVVKFLFDYVHQGHNMSFYFRAHSEREKKRHIFDNLEEALQLDPQVK